MARRSAVSKVVAGVAIGGALTLTSVFGGVVSADINIGVGELQECTISKSMDADGDVDGRDFLVWQRSSDAPAPSLSGSDLADWQANYGTGGF